MKLMKLSAVHNVIM